MKISAMAAAALITVVAASGASAQIGDGSELNLFISPCGEPFTAPIAEAYPIVKWFKQADANSDGKLDIDEMRADATRFFKVLDRNGDGVIEPEEVTYYEQNIVPVILRMGALDGVPSEGRMIPVVLQRGVQSIDPGGAQPGDSNVSKQRLNGELGAVPFSLLREPEPVRSADRNLDYLITIREFQDQSDRHFHALDKNQQGYLLLAELPRTDMEKTYKAHR
jgi:Ca2+-binding EF-hand superfamily protein